MFDHFKYICPLSTTPSSCSLSQTAQSSLFAVNNVRQVYEWDKSHCLKSTLWNKSMNLTSFTTHIYCCASFHYVCVCLPHCLSKSLSACLSVCLPAVLSCDHHFVSLFLHDEPAHCLTCSSLQLSVSPSVCIPACLSVHLFICLSVCLFIHLPTFLSIHFSDCLSFRPPACLSCHPSHLIIQYILELN